jgi:hypothetical protein
MYGKELEFSSILLPKDENKESKCLPIRNKEAQESKDRGGINTR